MDRARESEILAEIDGHLAAVEALRRELAELQARKSEPSAHPDLCTLGFDPATATVTMTWKGYATSRHFREASESVLAYFTGLRARRMLADATEFTLIGAEDQRWLAEDWLPRMIRAGFRACAVVYPRHFFNRVAVENVGRAVDRERLALAYFEDPDSARSWLEAQPA